MAWWLGIGVGVGVMGGYAALRVWGNRLARRQSDVRAFLLVELGGLGGRLLLVLGAVALVVGLVPVHVGAFVGTVLSLLTLSIALEVARFARHGG